MQKRPLAVNHCYLRQKKMNAFPNWDITIESPVINVSKILVKAAVFGTPPPWMFKCSNNWHCFDSADYILAF